MATKKACQFKKQIKKSFGTIALSNIWCIQTISASRLPLLYQSISIPTHFYRSLSYPALRIVTLPRSLLLSAPSSASSLAASPMTHALTRKHIIYLIYLKYNIKYFSMNISPALTKNLLKLYCWTFLNSFQTHSHNFRTI